MEKSIGALWLNESKKGNKYMSGNVEIQGVKHKIVVFKNNYKDDDKKPDYRIFPSQSQNEAPQDFENDIPF
jgi:uncharacterized protein (DUF736 family)